MTRSLISDMDLETSVWATHHGTNFNLLGRDQSNQSHLNARGEKYVTTSQSSQRVLVADDDPMIRRLDKLSYST